MYRIMKDGIWGLIVGDAMGAAVEFGERWMRDFDPVKEMRSGGMFEVPIGGWTDDTSMALATLQSLKSGYHPVDIMEQFVAWLRHGKYSLFTYPIGIGKQILRAIEAYEKYGDIHTCGPSTERDNGNGSLMRILPVCLYGYSKQKAQEMSTEEVLVMIHEVSGLTHNHMRSKIACGLYYFMMCEVIERQGTLLECMQKGLDKGFQFYRTNDIGNVAGDSETELAHYKRLENLYIFKEEVREHINSTGYVVDTLEAAVWCLITEDNYERTILEAVNLGLDTDTIAAVAGGLAGLYYGYEGIPEEWIQNIKKKDIIEECLYEKG